MDLQIMIVDVQLSSRSPSNSRIYLRLTTSNRGSWHVSSFSTTDITVEWKIIGFMNFNGRLVTIDFDDHSISRRFIVQFDGEFYHFEHSYALTNTETDTVFRRVKSIMIRYARLLMIRYCYATAQDDERVRTEFDFVFLSILNLYF